MSDADDIRGQTLRQIGDEAVATGADIGARIDATSAPLEPVQATLRELAEQRRFLEFAEQQRFVVRHLDALSRRYLDVEAEVEQLGARVDAIEPRLIGRGAPLPTEPGLIRLGVRAESVRAATCPGSR